MRVAITLFALSLALLIASFLVQSAVISAEGLSVWDRLGYLSFALSLGFAAFASGVLGLLELGNAAIEREEQRKDADQ